MKSPVILPQCRYDARSHGWYKEGAAAIVWFARTCVPVGVGRGVNVGTCISGSSDLYHHHYHRRHYYDELTT